MNRFIAEKKLDFLDNDSMLVVSLQDTDRMFVIRKIVKDDAEGFVARLSPESREKFGVKEFQATRKELIRTMGTPISFRYITTLEFVAVQPHIWKVRFEREDRKGEKFRSETLFRVITGRANDGTILVLGFNFL